jgi:DNA-binding NarL/FixJ family response regulator
MKFLVADDHELIRQGVKGLLRGLDPDAQFDEADTWETLAAAAPFMPGICRSTIARS